MAMIHVNRGATSLGAFPEEQVREGIRSGRFLSTDLGWKEGMANWQPLSQFSEFAADLSAAPGVGAPPPQTPAPSPTVAPVGSTAVPRGGLPWDARASKGLFSAFIETLQMVLTRPTEAFTAMSREGGLGDPLLYAVIGSSFGTVFAFLYNFAFRSLNMFPSRHTGFENMVGGIGLIFLLIFTPLLVVIGVFIWSAVLHVCLLLVGGAKQSFETTFRVVCFGGGSINPLLVIPFCGGLVVFIWKIVLYTIGLSRAHETDTGRALLAVLLPLIVCCGAGIALAVMFGALAGWGAAQH
jgi:hypothetical protein